jgi:hypothetical protein
MEPSEKPTLNIHSRKDGKNAPNTGMVWHLIDF